MISSCFGFLVFGGGVGGRAAAGWFGFLVAVLSAHAEPYEN
jgi:hypothetical protein